MAETAPDEFKQTLSEEYYYKRYPEQPHDNPIVTAVKDNNFDALKIFAETAPEEFLNIFKNYKKPE